MLSLETAKRLKEAGIAPLYGHLQEEWQYKCEYHGELKYEDDTKRVHIGRHEIREYYPLEYILAEIERLGWKWVLLPDGIRVYRPGISEDFKGKPAEAAAQALLWILEREKNCCAG